MWFKTKIFLEHTVYHLSLVIWRRRCLFELWNIIREPKTRKGKKEQKKNTDFLFMCKCRLKQALFCVVRKAGIYYRFKQSQQCSGRKWLTDCWLGFNDNSHLHIINKKSAWSQITTWLPCQKNTAVSWFSPQTVMSETKSCGRKPHLQYPCSFFFSPSILAILNNDFSVVHVFCGIFCHNDGDPKSMLKCSNVWKWALHSSFF